MQAQLSRKAQFVFCRCKHAHSVPTGNPEAGARTAPGSVAAGGATTPHRPPAPRPLTAQAGAARRRPAAEEEEAAVEGVGAVGQRRVQLQQEGQRAAAQRAGQLLGPRQPGCAQPRRPPAHLAWELLAAQPPGRRLLHEAQLSRPRTGGRHRARGAGRSEVCASRPEDGSWLPEGAERRLRSDWATGRGGGTKETAGRQVSPRVPNFRSRDKGAGLGLRGWNLGFRNLL